MVPPAYGRAPPPARRRWRQAGRGRRPPVESRPLDHLYTVATQGRAGALPAVQAVRQPAVQRGPLPGMPGGSRHSEARDPTLPGPHEHPVQTAGMPLPRNGGRAERRRRGGPGGRAQGLPEPYGYAITGGGGGNPDFFRAEGTTTTTTSCPTAAAGCCRVAGV